MTLTQSPETALTAWSNAEYHADTSRVSKSGLDKIAKSPAHYFYHYLSADRPQKEETPALRLGSAFHAATLELTSFFDNYTWLADAEIVAEIGGANPRATAKYKAWKAEFELYAAGKTVLTRAEWEICSAMRAAVWAHPLAAKLLAAPGPVEQTHLFTEPVSGAPCKIRPDKVAELDGTHYIVDLKSTEDASEASFGRSAHAYGYHKQGAFYCDGYEAATGIKPEAFVLIAVEKSAPYNVAVYFLDDEALQLGRTQYREQCQAYADCLAANQWPGYPAEVNNLKLPAYAFTK